MRTFVVTHYFANESEKEKIISLNNNKVARDRVSKLLTSDKEAVCLFTIVLEDKNCQDCYWKAKSRSHIQRVVKKLDKHLKNIGVKYTRTVYKPCVPLTPFVDKLCF